MRVCAVLKETHTRSTTLQTKDRNIFCDPAFCEVAWRMRGACGQQVAPERGTGKLFSCLRKINYVIALFGHAFEMEGNNLKKVIWKGVTERAVVFQNGELQEDVKVKVKV